MLGFATSLIRVRRHTESDVATNWCVAARGSVLRFPRESCNASFDTPYNYNLNRMPALDLIAANLQRVQDRISAAAHRANRNPSNVQLIGVTKYVDADQTRLLYQAGCHDLGESRPQSFWEKAEVLADLPVRWHMIGHLQRNKIKRTLPLVSLLHSGDSLRLLTEVNEEAAKLDRVVDVLVEVNISGDESKHGFAPDDVESALTTIATLTKVRVRGLMTMASLDGDNEQARREFASLRDLRDRLSSNCPLNVSLAELSMGMSGDFEEAILEGATMVRVGSALWEGVE